MKALIKRSMKYILLLIITIVVTSCESSDSLNRYESLTTEKVIGVLDRQTSEVYIFDTANETWFSIGRPNETPFTTVNRPKKKVSY